jgi:MerR family transcriptional regulator, light-induced transcriptional regulator
MAAGGGPHRIGEFARRVGVSPQLLRAWEQRYGLLQPTRSAGGFRLYGEEDAARVARMHRALGDGLSASEAARVALDAVPSTGDITANARTRLTQAIEEYDEAGVQATLDDGLAAFGVESFVRDLILPVLADVGRRWEQGELEISHEHFASHLIRGRLLALARLWGRGTGPLALLACAPGERHDISLLSFGVLLRSYGWRILFLGADTPIATVKETAQTVAPAVVVIVSFDPANLESEDSALRALARRTALLLAGPGASPERSGRLRVRRLDGDLVQAASEVAHMRNA